MRFYHTLAVTSSGTECTRTSRVPTLCEWARRVERGADSRTQGVRTKSSQLVAWRTGPPHANGVTRRRAVPPPRPVLMTALSWRREREMGTASCLPQKGVRHVKPGVTRLQSEGATSRGLSSESGAEPMCPGPGCLLV